jgi:hypothetical protein
MNATNQPSILEHLTRCGKDDFPNGSDYIARYKAIETSLNENIHPFVTPAASSVDGGYLTGHGISHIQTVMARVSDLLGSSPLDSLSCYELYLLLAAIHVHDVGNIQGRKNHESAAADAVNKYDIIFGTDDVEKRLIFRIADAHTGRRGSDKDKVSKLQETDHVLGKTVHPRFMAALLRFADELADDRSRTSKTLLDSAALTKDSEIYHRYCYALHSVVVSGDTVRLSFDMTSGDAGKTFQKDGKDIYLLDEICDRMMKMHSERIYCVRFFPPTIRIDRIDVSITVYGPHYIDDPLAVINFRMEEAGYPPESSRGIFEICPQLENHLYGSPLTGKSLKDYLDRNSQ